MKKPLHGIWCNGFLTLKKGHKPETFVFFKKYLTLLGISLPSITLSAIEVQVSRIPTVFPFNVHFGTWTISFCDFDERLPQHEIKGTHPIFRFDPFFTENLSIFVSF